MALIEHYKTNHEPLAGAMTSTGEVHGKELDDPAIANVPHLLPWWTYYKECTKLDSP